MGNKTESGVELHPAPKTMVPTTTDWKQDIQEGSRVPERRSHGRYLDKFIEDGREHEAEQIKKAVDRNLRRGMLTEEEEKALAENLESLKRLKTTINEYRESMNKISREAKDKLSNIGITSNSRLQEKKAYVAPSCESNELPGQHIDLSNYIPNVDPDSFAGIAEKMIELHERKNHDYGNAAHESYKEFGLISYVIRLNDKMKRLKSLTKPGAEQQVADEKIEDTLMDLAAYSIMAIESLKSDE